MVGSKGAGNTTRDNWHLWGKLYGDGKWCFVYDPVYGRRDLDWKQWLQRKYQDRALGLKTRIRVRAGREVIDG